MIHEPLPQDDLRALWQAERVTAPVPAYDAGAIQAMLRQRSRLTLARLRRQVQREMLLLAVSALASLPALAWPALWPLVSFVWVLALVGLVFYARKYRHLAPEAWPDDDLRQALRRQTHHLRQYLRLYAVISLLLVPALGAAGLIYGLWFGLSQDGLTLGQLSGMDWAWTLAAALAYATLATLLARHVVWRLYGRPYHALCACLEELEALEA